MTTAASSRLLAKAATHREAEVVLVLAVDGVGEMLVAGLREAVLLVQDVQDAQNLGLHQVCRERGGGRGG